MVEKKRKRIASKKRLHAIRGSAHATAANVAGKSSDDTSSSNNSKGFSSGDGTSNSSERPSSNNNSKGDGINNNSARRSSRIKKNEDLQQTKTTKYLLFSNLYTSPSSLVRAMMFLGCVDEDSPMFIEAEINSCSPEYPQLASLRGGIRQSRAWKSESHRIEAVRMLLDAYPQGMGVPCNSDPDVEDENLPTVLFGGGGETPLIMAVRTFKGEGLDEEDEDFNMDVLNGDGVGGPNNADGVGGGANAGLCVLVASNSHVFSG